MKLGCAFCRGFDFGIARTFVSAHGSSIVLSGGNSRFPANERFKYCPECGTKLIHDGGEN